MGLFFMLPLLLAQTRTVVGLRDNTPGVYALTNTRIIVNPERVLENSTLVIRNGIIEAVGERVAVPADAWVIDLQGKSIYPGFIDLWVEAALPVMEMPASQRGEAEGNWPRPSADPQGAVHWNPQVRPGYHAGDFLAVSEKTTAAFRSQGITISHNIPLYGIFRGQSALMSLGNGPVSDLVMQSQVAQVLSFNASRELGRGYPTSLMGVISLMRQTWYDAQWYEQAWQVYQRNPQGLKRPEKNLGLEALGAALQGRQPVLFDADNEYAVIKAAEIASEFGLKPWIRASGYEYRRLEAIRALNIPLIVPVNFPAAPELDRPEKSMNVTLEQLRHWDHAPENPARLHQAGVTFAFTSFGLKDQTEFLKNIRIAVERGLPWQAALRALTITPASMLGLQSKAGSLEAGKMAHFIITDGDLFQENTRIAEVWVDGTPYLVNPQPEVKPTGSWMVQAGLLPEFEMEIRENRDRNRLSGIIRIDNKQLNISQVSFDGHRLAVAFRGDSLQMQGTIRFSVALDNKQMFGIGEFPQGEIIQVQGRRLTSAERPEATPVRKVRMAEGPMRFPSMEFGVTHQPDQPQQLLIRNAIIWTQGPQGRLEGADMLVSKGKIVKVGHNLQAPRGAMIIDAQGRHITPGLIDPHSHASIPGGVNEVGNAIVPETRIEDVINGDNIWTYRLLAGGLTTASLLHGSANPIGGQNGVIKNRWGAMPKDMLAGAKPGLKLALGENVKGNSMRYPNTRMGSEQIIRDAFMAARQYQAEILAWEKNKKGIPPRRNLQLDALVEVLNGQRLVHAHAYRQDEMQMLIRLAEEIGFKIASFEHAVEGYKIAEILAAHGAAAVVWTDWSSFKMEAYDGILHNARLLIEQGVLTTLHSDNTQLSTRMNWEAGKALATGIDEITAMDMITINPARVLGAEKTIGSLEPGKDADFVIWNTHPLSGFSHAEQTWIDGRRYFDRQQDLEMRQEMIHERAVLIQKILDEKAATPDARAITQRNETGVNQPSELEF